MRIFLIVALIQPIYLCGKIVQIWVEKTYKNLPKIPLILMILLSLVIRFVLVNISYRYYKRFLIVKEFLNNEEKTEKGDDVDDVDDVDTEKEGIDISENNSSDNKIMTNESTDYEFDTKSSIDLSED
ncbi:hypothetical protein M0812_29959 [Anaeramoeba flamelloides]|uniref:Uncharacterized protein n=1 Tax=Anaeramoeba flamelloides TaxID=1746091 RepID=A0AAV7Y5J6_9EUKA|nr:hypothetical protein M0812_29959 [Anaeramoeba flamelloides]